MPPLFVFSNVRLTKIFYIYIVKILKLLLVTLRVCVEDCHGKSCIEQEEESFYQQIGLKFEEETNKMLHLEHGFVWC